MRIILIPGLGEDEIIFNHVLPLVEGDKLVLNTWKISGDKYRGKIKALDLAREVAEHYNICRDDVVIGHSLGGLISLYIKHITGCKIVQIASYTHHDRIIVPVRNYELIKIGIKSHLFFNQFMRWLIVQLQYRSKPSKIMLIYAFDRLKNGNKNNVINQLAAALIPLKPRLNVQPDLRIHSKGDRIVRPPKEPYIEVPGDHFSLYTHPADVAAAINNFLRSLKNENA